MKIITITCIRIMDVHKKHNFFVSVHPGAGLVKSALPAKLVFLTPTLLREGPAGDAC